MKINKNETGIEVEILPLGGKYYGTEIKVGQGSFRIWGCGKENDYTPSSRETDGLEEGEEFETCDNHYEKQQDYEIALVVEKALREHFKGKTNGIHI